MLPARSGFANRASLVHARRLRRPVATLAAVTSQTDRPTVIERKIRLDGSVEEFVCEILALEAGRRAVLRYVLDRDWHVAGTILIPKGTSTISHYWTDRPYNVYHWAQDTRSIAHYVNIADRTEIAPGLVAYRDLVVDVLVRPSGAIEILDEDELPTDLEPAARKSIADALEVVVTGARGLVREIERESARFR